MLNKLSCQDIFALITLCPDKMTFNPVFCQQGSVDTFLVMKPSTCSCSFLINSVPGVTQLESKLFNPGLIFPYNRLHCLKKYEKKYSEIHELSTSLECAFVSFSKLL
jgi:hypothetical protein